MKEGKRLHRKLVVFDVEGVLLPKNRYLIFEAGRKIEYSKRFKLFLFGLFYHVRLLTLERALKHIFKLFEGFRIEELLSLFQGIPLMPHVENVFSQFKSRGLKVALISSGLPKILVDSLASHLKADYAFGLELETEHGVLTGNIYGDVIRNRGKARVLDKILKLENLKPIDCVVIADDRNNIPIFYSEALKIGYNPDSSIIRKSDYVVKEDLREILSILKGTAQPSKLQLLSRNEVIRETIHSSGFFVIIIANYLGDLMTEILLLIIICLYATSELARVNKRKTPLVSSITLNAATIPEQYEYAITPLFLALGVVLSLTLFPTAIGFASIAIVTLGDSAASIVGKLMGRTPIPFNKSKNVEGTIAGFFPAFLGATLFLSIPGALIGSIIGMLVEALPLPINDNLSIPLITGTLLTLIPYFQRFMV